MQIKLVVVVVVVVSKIKLNCMLSLAQQQQRHLKKTRRSGHFADSTFPEGQKNKILARCCCERQSKWLTVGTVKECKFPDNNSLGEQRRLSKLRCVL